MNISSKNTSSQISLVVWLFSLTFLVFLMIIIGGLTRLTGSGLSMVDWRPIMGTLPPLTQSAWIDAFNNYKGTPDWEKKEFKAVLKDTIKDLAKTIKHYNRVKNLKEGKLNEEKYVVASIYGDLYTPKAVPEKQALKLMMKLAKQYAGDNVFMLGVKAWNKPHKFNKKKIKVKEGKLTESQVAKTILQQLGGNKFIAMTGAKNLGASGRSLQMKIGRNSKSISHVIITLKSSDLYDMEFIRVRGTSRKVVKKVTGVYNDMLGKIFTKYTGLRVRL